MSFRTVRRSVALLTLTIALGTLGAAPSAAQDDGTTITVTAMDYHFDGLPTSVPVGTSLALVNEGAEVHELIVARRNDGVTESWDELLAMPEEQVMAKVTLLGPIFAGPGETAEGVIALDQEGDYFAVCFIPQGMTEMPDLAASPDPGASFGPPHAMLGMQQQFTVTAPGTTPGPIPSPGHEPMQPEARVIELEMNAQLQIVQDGTQIKEIPVTIGETIAFRIANTAGYAHNFWIGSDQALMTNQTEGLPGIPDYSEGTLEFTWTVPEDAASLKFGCTVPGHYMLMNGSFVVEG